jgi:hypothetical protein
LNNVAQKDCCIDGGKAVKEHPIRACIDGRKLKKTEKQGAFTYKKIVSEVIQPS